MALFKSKLLTPALFAGLLYGSVIAIQIPVTPQGGANFNAWSARSPSVQPKLQIKGFFNLLAKDYSVTLSALEAKGRAVYELTGSEFNTEFSGLRATSASRVLLVPVNSSLRLQELQAAGLVDITDEDLLLLLAGMV